MAVIPYSTPPVFVNGRPLAAAEVNIFADNAATLDMLSYRGRRAWTNQTYRLEAYGGNPSPLGYGAFQFRSGLTTLTVQYGANQSGDSLKIYLNDVLRSTTTMAAGGGFVNVAISALGYTDYQFIEMRVEVVIAGARGIYDLYDAYVSPVSGIALSAGTWPGVPSFTDISAAKLNQLSTCEEWLMQRLAVTLQPAFQSQQYRNGEAWNTTQLLWQGGIARGNGANRLNLSLGYYTVTNTAEALKLYVNGSLAVTGPTWSAGQAGNYLMQFDLSAYGDQTNLDVRLDQVVTGSVSSGAHPSRYLLQDIYTDRASTYPYAAAVAQSSPRESMTFTTLQARLNAIGTILSNTYTRINATADVFDRMRLYRWRPVLDDGQKAYFKDLYVARCRRWTDALWVRGKGLQIAYGTRTITPALDDAYKYDFQYKTEIIGGDTVQDKLIYLDQYPGLAAGMDFFIIGLDCRAVFEQVR